MNYEDWQLKRTNERAAKIEQAILDDMPQFDEGDHVLINWKDYIYPLINTPGTVLLREGKIYNVLLKILDNGTQVSTFLHEKYLTRANPHT